MFKQKSKKELSNHLFTKIKNEMFKTEERVDKILKTLYTDRYSFSIDNIEFAFIDEDATVITISGTFCEQVWDIDKQEMLNEYRSKKIELHFEYDYFNIEDLALIIYGKLLNILDE